MIIIIADDHAIFRKGIIELLLTEFTSIEIHEAVNGKDLLDKIDNAVWDLILLDISMPVLNGIETLKQIRAAGTKVPIIMLSSQPEDQFAIQVLKEGASGFVHKSKVSEELIIAIRIVLSGKKYVSASFAEKSGFDLEEL